MLFSALLKRNARFPVIRIESCDPETGDRLELRTNRLVLGASTIAAIQEVCCESKPFGGAPKQHPMGRTFVRSGPNVLRIQIWSVGAAILLLDCIRLRSRLDRVLFNGVALLRQNALT